jgi:hypothetical protein
VQITTAGFPEYVAILHRGLLERLETVRRKSRAKNIQPLEPAATEFCDSFVSIGLQPFRFPQARLERDHALVAG